MPKQKPIKSYSHVTGMIADPRSRRGNFAQAAVEIDFQTVIAYDPRVKAYKRPPIALSYVDANGKDQRYTPDLEVTYSGLVLPGQWSEIIIYEVKEWLDLKKYWFSKYRRIFEQARVKLRAKGIEFRVVTDRRIRTLYLANVRKLSAAADFDIPSSQMEYIIKLVDARPSVTFEDLITAVGGDTRATKRAIWNLLYNRQLIVNLHKPIEYDTCLYPKNYSVSIMQYPNW